MNEKITYYQTEITGTKREKAEGPVKVPEICNVCGEEVDIFNVYAPQTCPNCLNTILPCSICNHQHCAICPLETAMKSIASNIEKRGTAEDYEKRIFKSRLSNCTNCNQEFERDNQEDRLCSICKRKRYGKFLEVYYVIIPDRIIYSKANSCLYVVQKISKDHYETAKDQHSPSDSEMFPLKALLTTHCEYYLKIAEIEIEDFNQIIGEAENEAKN